jgi:nucleoside-diphosphate-sugar epimerase
MILVTGADGLIGRHICALLKSARIAYRPFDLRRSATEDIRNRLAMAKALKGVRGVVHLAAVSRVVWGERDPVLCAATNVDALADLLRLCVEGSRPWFIFASSREVYGEPDRVPVFEDDPLRPLNHYARSKFKGEVLVRNALDAGLHANICRFSNVFGCPLDHPDRVAMAFAAGAARGGRISVEGPGNTFDFTSVRDVVDGLWRLIEATAAGERLPPIHFVSGRGTTLGELAQMAAEMARADLVVEEAASRSFDVSRFIGNANRAKALIGWSAATDVRTEFAKLVNAIASEAMPRVVSTAA